MTVINTTTNVIKLKLRQEKGDKDYGECLWCDVIIDREAYAIYIDSDCGGFTYSWTPTPKTESFVKLLCRMNSDYFLGKISDMEFDLGESIELTISNLKKFLDEKHGLEATLRGYGTTERDSICEIDCDNAAEFLSECQNILDASDEEYYNCKWGIADAVEVYPCRAVKIASIFKEYIQPFLRANFLEEAER